MELGPGDPAPAAGAAAAAAPLPAARFKSMLALIEHARTHPAWHGDGLDQAVRAQLKHHAIHENKLLTSPMQHVQAYGDMIRAAVAAGRTRDIAAAVTHDIEQRHDGHHRLDSARRCDACAMCGSDSLIGVYLPNLPSSTRMLCTLLAVKFHVDPVESVRLAQNTTQDPEIHASLVAKDWRARIHPDILQIHLRVGVHMARSLVIGEEYVADWTAKLALVKEVTHGRARLGYEFPVRLLLLLEFGASAYGPLFGREPPAAQARPRVRWFLGDVLMPLLDALNNGYEFENWLSLLDALNYTGLLLPDTHSASHLQRFYARKITNAKDAFKMKAFLGEHPDMPPQFRDYVMSVANAHIGTEHKLLTGDDNRRTAALGHVLERKGMPRVLVAPIMGMLSNTYTLGVHPTPYQSQLDSAAERHRTAMTHIYARRSIGGRGAGAGAAASAAPAAANASVPMEFDEDDPWDVTLPGVFQLPATALSPVRAPVRSNATVGARARRGAGDKK